MGGPFEWRALLFKTRGPNDQCFSGESELDEGGMSDGHRRNCRTVIASTPWVSLQRFPTEYTTVHLAFLSPPTTTPFNSDQKAWERSLELLNSLSLLDSEYFLSSPIFAVAREASMTRDPGNKIKIDDLKAWVEEEQWKRDSTDRVCPKPDLAEEPQCVNPKKGMKYREGKKGTKQAWWRRMFVRSEKTTS